MMRTSIFLFKVAVVFLVVGCASETKSNISSPTKETLDQVSTANQNPVTETKGVEYAVIAETTEIRSEPSKEHSLLRDNLKRGTRLNLIDSNGKEDEDNQFWLEVVGYGDKSWVKAYDVIPMEEYDVFDNADKLAKAGDSAGMCKNLKSVEGKHIYRDLIVSPDKSKAIVYYVWFLGEEWHSDRDFVLISGKGLINIKSDYWLHHEWANYKHEWEVHEWSPDSRYYMIYSLGCCDTNDLSILDINSLKWIYIGSIEPGDENQENYEFYDGYFLWIEMEITEGAHDSHWVRPTLRSFNLSNHDKVDILVPECATFKSYYHDKIDIPMPDHTPIKVQGGTTVVKLVEAGSIPETLTNSKLYKYYTSNPLTLSWSEE